jgi:hypothetical protein
MHLELSKHWVDHRLGQLVARAEDLPLRSDPDILAEVLVEDVQGATHMVMIGCKESSRTRSWTEEDLELAFVPFWANDLVVDNLSTQIRPADSCCLWYHQYPCSLRDYEFKMTPLTFGPILVTLLLTPSACHTARLGSIAEVSLPFLRIG